VSHFEDLDTFLSEGNRLTNTHAFFFQFTELYILSMYNNLKTHDAGLKFDDFVICRDEKPVKFATYI